MGARFNKEMQDYGQLPVTGIAAPMDPEMGMMLKPDAQAGPPVEQMELEGGAQKPGFSNTLDESVSDTLMRDIMMVLNKLKFVMWPRGGGIQQLGKDWDLWGPLLLCLALSMILSSAEIFRSFILSVCWDIASFLLMLRHCSVLCGRTLCGRPLSYPYVSCGRLERLLDSCKISCQKSVLC